MKNWDDLRYYLAVARRGSVSAAASEMKVSHATVLRRIDKLEEDFKVKLFKRLQSGYQLSEAGEALYEQVEQLEAGVLKLGIQVQGQDQDIAGTLRVSQPLDGSLNLYRLYADFLREHPQVQLEILPGLEHNKADLNRHEADVAVWLTDEPPELLVGRCVGHIVYSAYASPEYLSRFEGEPPLADIDWIIQARSVSNWGGGRDRTNSAFQQLYDLVEEPKIIMDSTVYAETIAAVREGLGVGFLSRVYAHGRDDVVPMLGSPIVAQRKVWVLTHRKLRHMARVQCFMRFIAEGLERQLARQES